MGLMDQAKLKSVDLVHRRDHQRARLLDNGLTRENRRSISSALLNSTSR